jgi:FtsH-binding integral membrane protein
MQHYQQPGGGYGQGGGFQAAGTFGSDVRAQESERAFFTAVFGWMCGALALTGVSAYVTATTPSLLEMVYGNYWLFIIPVLAMAFIFPGMAPRLPLAANGALLGLFSVLFGMMMSYVFIIYEMGSIFEIFLLTGGIFGTMAVYGMTTKKDLTSWGTFLMMGLVGIIIAGVINIFVRNDMAGFVITCIGVVVFTGFTAYDVQRLRVYHSEMNGSAAVSSLAVVGAFTLYLNFINLFLKLLRLFGRRR